MGVGLEGLDIWHVYTFPSRVQVLIVCVLCCTFLTTEAKHEITGIVTGKLEVQNKAF